MPTLSAEPIRSLEDLRRFEREMTLEQRLPERSVYDVFCSAAQRHSERTALTMVMTGEPDEKPQRVSYAALLQSIRRAANLFAELGGARPGVAVMLPNLVQTHVALWGAETAGFALPINYLLQEEHIAALIRATGVRLLVALGPHPAADIWPKAQRLREQIAGLTLLRVDASGAASEAGDGIDFHAALQAQPAHRLACAQPGRDQDLAAYFHTGGTTAPPKLVAHTHRGQLVAAFGSAVMRNLGPDDVSLAPQPLFHVAGTIASALASFMAGAELVVLSPTGLRNPAMVRNFWRLVQRWRASVIGGVPTGLAAVLEQPLDGADISTLRAAVVGAALCPPAVAVRLRQVTGLALHEGYGMTESSGFIGMDPVGGEGGAGSVGWAMPYTEIVVRRVHSGEPCATHEIGEVTVRGPHVSPGYRDAAHEGGVFVDSVLHTGDLGWIGDDARLHIAGRSKNLIIRSGHNIDPTMIENAMTQHPAVAAAAAVGMPDAHAGEVPVCFVVLRPGAAASGRELTEHAQRTIGERPAWPRHLFVVDEIPQTAVGKPYKPRLRCDAAARVVTRLLRCARAACAACRFASRCLRPMRRRWPRCATRSPASFSRRRSRSVDDQGNAGPAKFPCSPSGADAARRRPWGHSHQNRLSTPGARKRCWIARAWLTQPWVSQRHSIRPPRIHSSAA